MKIADYIEEEKNTVPSFDETPEVEELPEQTRGFSFDLGWLKTETGPGPIEDYLDHPLNFNRSHALAQTIRGISGFTENLRLAVVDIAVGLYRMRKQ